MPESIWAARICDSARWFVVHSQPHRELKAHWNLANQGFKAFLPLHTKTVRHARRFRTSATPLYPRYLFVSLTPGIDRWRSVNNTIGVSHMIMEGEGPKPVPPGVVEALLEAADPDTGMLSLNSTVQPGERVRLVKGPFANLVGTLVALEDNDRVKVLIELLGSKIFATTTRQGLVPA